MNTSQIPENVVDPARQVIPEAAVAAAAFALYESPDISGVGLADIRRALEAAAPHMSHDPYGHDAERYNQRGDYDKVSP